MSDFGVVGKFVSVIYQFCQFHQSKIYLITSTTITVMLIYTNKSLWNLTTNNFVDVLYKDPK